MYGSQRSMLESSEIKTFERNRYFYGKLLDSYHFELETAYQNTKRWLINRLVLGHGVVCGLNVEPGDNEHSVVISPGVAIDKWGREIVVPERTQSIRIPDDVIAKAAEAKRRPGEQRPEQAHPDQRQHDDARVCVQVMLCFHECETDPAPVLAGDCHNSEPCAPGKISEQYRIEFLERCVHPDNHMCQFPHIAARGRIDYPALVRWVTLERECLELPKNPCIRLAHVHLWKKEGHRCNAENIDITVRPIVYSNDLLFDILLGWQEDSYGARRQNDSEER